MERKQFVVAFMIIFLMTCVSIIYKIWGNVDFSSIALIIIGICCPTICICSNWLNRIDLEERLYRQMVKFTKIENSVELDKYKKFINCIEYIKERKK